MQEDDKPEFNLQLAGMSNPQDELLLGQRQEPCPKECLHKTQCSEGEE